MTRRVEADYLVVGAGATGMAFADALVEHSDARVVLVDRRHGPGGHWRAAYPFVRLHQSSSFYGVASTLFGGGRVQTDGPEAGLHERADQPEICTYYDDVLTDRLLATGRVEGFWGCEYVGDRTFVSVASGERFEVPDRCRLVDASYLAPDIPAEHPPRFEVDDGARVIPVNDLVALEEALGHDGRYVVVGSGKTATDACVWLLGRGVDPGAICWVRPREPWMLNRAVVQPNAAVFTSMAADTLEAAAVATSLDDLFLRLEDAGVMLRVDTGLTPTMAKAPTLGAWELDLLRTIEDVVRLGHLQRVRPGELELAGGSVRVARDAVVVNCAADGLKQPPLVPIWRPDAVTLQPVRAGFPCFGAALTGYVEATRHDDGEKNRLCAPSPYGNSLADWARMNLLGTRNAMAFGAEPDIADWCQGVALNPARVRPDERGSAAVDAATERLLAARAPGLTGLARLVGPGG